MRLILAHRTRLGPLVYIEQSDDGRFHVIWKDERLGSYHSARAAIDDAAGGHTHAPSDGTDLGKLGLSHDIGDWVSPDQLD